MAKIPFDSLTLCAVIHELRRILVGGFVQEIYQPGEFDVVLSVRHRGSTYRLMLSADPVWARVHLTQSARTGSKTPTAFCMALRKHLGGACITEIRQVDLDRILHLEVSRGGDTSAVLTAELMGKHSNIILMQPDRRITDAVKRVNARINRFREVLPGISYTPPPHAKGTLPSPLVPPNDIPLDGDPEAAVARLMARYQGLSPFLAHELYERARAGGWQAGWKEVWSLLTHPPTEPVVIRDASSRLLGAYPLPLVSIQADRQHLRETINTALDQAFSDRIRRSAFEDLKQTLTSRLHREISRVSRSITEMRQALQETDTADRVREDAELLLAYRHLVQRDSTSVEVPDLYNREGSTRVIALQCDKTPEENAQAKFERVRSLQRRREILADQQIPAAEERWRRLLSQAQRVEEAEDLRALQMIRDDVLPVLRSEEKAAAAVRHDRFEGRRVRTILTEDGWEILVGENAEANDYITTRFSAPMDVWLHVRGNTGAHVIVRCPKKGAAVPHHVLMQAAGLAALNSAAKHSSVIAVDWTLRKFVRKPRGSSPGTVVYEREKTLHIVRDRINA